jgi:outer membrane protein assembly factor BamB
MSQKSYKTLNFQAFYSIKPFLTLIFAIIAFFSWPDLCFSADWPQWLGPKRDGIWNEDGILTKFPKDGPKILWTSPLGGGYAGPAIANGRVFVTDRQISEGQNESDNLFARANSEGKERLLCLDASNGKPIWEFSYPCTYKMAYPCGPRCTPVVTDTLVYFLGAMGDLYCLDVKTGKPVWNKSFTKDYNAPVPVWGFSAHPLLDGNKLICLVGPKKVAVAFDAKTGKELWGSLELEKAESEIGYCPPVIFQIGTNNNNRHLIIWHSESLNGLDPETGKLLWSEPFRLKANLSISTPKLVDNKILISSFYNGSMLVEVDPEKKSSKLVWKGKGRGETPKQTDGLHSIMSTPFIENGYIFGVCSYGELRCIKLSDGERVWENLSATGSQNEPIERWGNAFLIKHNKNFFIFNEKGDLIISELSPSGYKELDRSHLIDPTGIAPTGGTKRKIVWTHPAFADKKIFLRNDKEIKCYSLAQE